MVKAMLPPSIRVYLHHGAIRPCQHNNADWAGGCGMCFVVALSSGVGFDLPAFFVSHAIELLRSFSLGSSISPFVPEHSSSFLF